MSVCPVCPLSIYKIYTCFNLYACLPACLSDWLTDCLSDWLTDWLTDYHLLLFCKFWFLVSLKGIYIGKKQFKVWDPYNTDRLHTFASDGSQQLFWPQWVWQELSEHTTILSQWRYRFWEKGICFFLLYKIDPCNIHHEYNLSPLGNEIYCNAKIFHCTVLQHGVCRRGLLY